MPNGTGRSNALPTLQIVLGAALAILGALNGLRGSPESWVGWFLAASGLVQIGVGALTIRRNQRLDRLESRD